jgi:hypothetical protein
MTASKRKSICLLCGVLVLFLVGGAFGFDNSPSESMVPDSLIIEDIYKPGIGSPVGEVRLVQGKVVIIHRDIFRGYWAKKDLPLFKGDTIATQERGRIRLKLNDGSTLTMASRTKLVINRSVYDSTNKSRSSFLGMTLGKARFWVTKLMDFKRSEFKVKTETAVMGVRGSDFVIRATPKLTEVTALGDTRLELVSLAAPEVKPTLLADFERAVVEEGALPSEVEKISPEEIDQIKNEFKVAPEGAGPEGKVAGWIGKGKGEKREDGGEKGEDKGEKKEKGGAEERAVERGEDAGEKDQGDEGGAEDGAGEEDEKAPSEKGADEEVTRGEDTAEGGPGGAVPAEVGVVEGSTGEQGVVEEIPVFVSADDLVTPQDLGEPEVFEGPLSPAIDDIVEREEISTQVEEFVEQREQILEEQHEEAMTDTGAPELPAFPGLPQ